jgi:hypothetical protein
MPRRYYAVDQISGGVAVLVDDDRRPIAVPLNRLPRSTQQGALLAIPLDRSGTPSWSDATVDVAETRRRTQGVAQGAQQEVGVSSRDRQARPHSPGLLGQLPPSTAGLEHPPSSSEGPPQLPVVASSQGFPTSRRPRADRHGATDTPLLASMSSRESAS